MIKEENLIISNEIVIGATVAYEDKNKKKGILLGALFGFTLMLWITIQFIIFPLNVLSISFFIIGLIQLITGYMTYVFYMQENYVFDFKKYTNIGKDKGIYTCSFYESEFCRGS